MTILSALNIFNTMSTRKPRPRSPSPTPSLNSQTRFPPLRPRLSSESLKSPPTTFLDESPAVHVHIIPKPNFKTITMRTANIDMDVPAQHFTCSNCLLGRSPTLINNISHKFTPNHHHHHHQASICRTCLEQWESREPQERSSRSLTSFPTLVQGDRDDDDRDSNDDEEESAFHMELCSVGSTGVLQGVYDSLGRAVGGFRGGRVKRDSGVGIME